MNATRSPALYATSCSEVSLSEETLASSTLLLCTFFLIGAAFLDRVSRTGETSIFADFLGGAALGFSLVSAATGLACERVFDLLREPALSWMFLADYFLGGIDLIINKRQI
jgi:hypothetical protein